MEGDIELYHTVPKGDGTFYEVPNGRPKLKPVAIPSLLPGCPPYYSSTVSAGVKRTCLSLDCKEQDFLNQAINLSLKSENIELERFSVVCIQEIKDELEYNLHKNLTESFESLGSGGCHENFLI